VCEVNNCLGFTNSKGVGFKVDFLCGKPGKKFVGVNGMLDVVEGTVSIDLASKLNLVLLVVAFHVPFALEVLFKLFFGHRELVLTYNDCTGFVECGYCKSGVKFYHHHQ